MLVFVPWWWFRRENTNTLIGAAILKSGHTYIHVWATLPRAHNSGHCFYWIASDEIVSVLDVLLNVLTCNIINTVSLFWCTCCSTLWWGKLFCSFQNHYYYALVSGAPEAYGSRFVCVYLYVCNSCFSEITTNYRHWWVQCRHNATIYQI